MKKNLHLIAALAIISASAHAAPSPTLAHAQEPVKTAAAAMTSRTGAFKGAEANGGYASLTGRTLKLSPDFKIPKAPAPTWQVVDREGNVYTLRQLNVVGGRTNRSVEIPNYVKSVAEVRIWCSFAEVNLGKASFEGAIALP